MPGKLGPRFWSWSTLVNHLDCTESRRDVNVEYIPCFSHFARDWRSVRVPPGIAAASNLVVSSIQDRHDCYASAKAKRAVSSVRAYLHLEKVYMAQQSSKTGRACDRCRERRVKGDSNASNFVVDGVLCFPESHRGSRPYGPSALITDPLLQEPLASESPSKGVLRRADDDQLKQPASSFDIGADSVLTQPLLFQEPNGKESWNETTFDPEWFDLEPDTFYSMGGNSCGFLPNLPNIVDEVDRKSHGTIESTDDIEQLSGISSLPERYACLGFYIIRHLLICLRVVVSGHRTVNIRPAPLSQMNENMRWRI
nr:hypothetical protein CFP56_71088 [Quercus suber]